MQGLNTKYPGNLPSESKRPSALFTQASSFAVHLLVLYLKGIDTK